MLCGIRSGPSQHSADPGGQLPETEGLGHIIIGTHFQAGYPVHFLGPRRQENHRYPALFPDLPKHIKTRHVRQSHIQDDQLRRMTVQFLQSSRTGIRDMPQKTLGLQRIGNCIGDGCFVFNYQDSWFHPLSCPCRSLEIVPHSPRPPKGAQRISGEIGFRLFITSDRQLCQSNPLPRAGPYS